MDHKQLEQINIERSKELFEYEMTEVILMLKGQFAAVSGKDLGLSQYQISQEQREAHKAASNAHIPAVEVKPVVIPDALVEKPVSPSIQTMEEPIRLDISVPGQKRFQCPVPQVQMEPLRPLDIPQPSAVAFPRNAPVAYTAPRIPVPAVQAIPPVTVPEVAVSCQKTQVHAAPHFSIAVPPVESAPVAVEVPKVATFAQMSKPIATIPNAVDPEKVAIPELPNLSIPAVALSPKPIDVPKIQKEWQKGSPKNGANAIEFPTIAKVEIKTHSFAPVKQIGVSPLPGVPEIPRLGAVQAITVDEVMAHSGVAIPAMPDLQKALDDILLAMAK